MRKEKVTPSGTPVVTNPRKRRDDAQQGRQHIADRFAFAGQDGARAFRSEERAHDADAEYDQGQQHQHFRGFEHEKSNRAAQMARG
jgi:hypothetical protein